MRSQVLACYRALHKTRQKCFAEILWLLTWESKKIREEFVKNKLETDPQKIMDFIKQAKDAEKVLRTMIVQAVKENDNVYKVKITEDTKLDINPAFPPKLHPLSSSKENKS